jgi:sugar lactone lactonase YvrE
MVFLETKVLLEGLDFAESPRWHNDKLCFSDMGAHKVMTVDLNGNSETIIEIPNSPSGLGWLPDGRLLVVSMENFQLLRLDPDGLTKVSDLSELASFHLNDMVVDKDGRAYIGNFGFDMFNGKPFAPAEIILVTPEGDARIVADNMAFPNGTVITPDDKTLIVAETVAAKLTAFDIMNDGSLTERRIWASLKSIVPDGICLDEEGGIWVAAPGRGRVVRVLEGGKITDKVKITRDVFACMLGGPNRDMLFICTATKERTNASIEYVKVDVPGTGLP